MTMLKLLLYVNVCVYVNVLLYVNIDKFGDVKI